MIMSIECLSLDIRNPQVHIPTAARRTVGLSTYNVLEPTGKSDVD